MTPPRASGAARRPSPPATAPAAGPGPGRETAFRVALLLLAVAGAQIWLVHDMNVLPSGYYGGDYTYQLGCIRSIIASRNPFASCSVSGGIPGYFPLYGTLVALVALVTRQDALPVMLAMTVLFRALSAFIVFRVFGRIFDRSTGLVIACLWSALHWEAIFKYTDFTTGLVMPLFFLALHRYLERPGPGRALGLGLSLAVLGYSHSVGFIGSVAVTGIAVAIGMFVRGGWRGLGRELVAALPHAAIVVAAASLALGYWYRPIFVHHGRTSLHYAEWTSVDVSTFEAQRSWAARVLRTEFSFDSVALGVLTLLSVAGLAVLVAHRARRRWAFAAVCAGAAFLWMFHYFATVPLLRTHFIPLYVQWMQWGVGRLLLAAIPVAALLARPRGERLARPIETLALGLALVGVAVHGRQAREGPAMDMARAPADPAETSLTRYVQTHVDPEAVVLSTNELSFAWSALTGRKVLVTRRGQNDAFMDMDVRNRDAALMLYGEDDSLRTRLLEKYRVGYLYWNVDWFRTEYTVAGRDTLANDPLFYFRNDAYDDQLSAAGVHFVHAWTWVDPALRGNDYPRFDLTVLSPRNYTRGNQPWRDDLGRRLEPVWFYPEEGDKRAALFRVKPPATPAP